MTEAKGPWRLDRWDVIIVIVLMLCLFVLFLTFLRPPRLADPLDYFYGAGNFDGLRQTHRHLRLGLIWPIHLTIAFFGYSELSYYLVPAAGSAFLMLSSYFLGRLLFDRLVGCAASILVLYNTPTLKDLTEPLPDYLAAGLFSSGVALLVWAWRSQRLYEEPLRSGTMTILILAGFAFGWSYLAREYVVVLFPLIPFIFFAAGGRFRAFLLVAFAAFLCWVAELTWGLAQYGDPLARLHEVSGPRSDPRFIETDPMGVLTELPNLLLRDHTGAMLAAAMIGGTVLAVARSIRGERRWQMLAVWILLGWGFFTGVALLPVLILGEGQLYLRMHKFRYWALIMPPLLIAGFAATQTIIQEAARVATRQYAFLAAPLAIGITSIFIAASATIDAAKLAASEKFMRNGGGDDYHEFRDFIRGVDRESELVLVEHGGDYRSATRSIPIYLNEWHGLGRVWHGKMTTASSGAWSGKQVDTDVTLQDLERRPGSKLVVLDLSRTAPGEPDFNEIGWDTVGLLDYLDATAERRFVSSSGSVLVYLMGGASGRGERL